MGALSFKDVSPNVLLNIANPTNGSKPFILTRISVYVFSLVAIGLGIPVISFSFLFHFHLDSPTKRFTV